MPRDYRGLVVICPRCDKKGFLTRRWVRGSSYIPWIASVYTMSVETYFNCLDRGREISPYLKLQASRLLEGRVRVLEHTGNFFVNDRQQHEYEYVYTHDPTETKLGVLRRFVIGKRKHFKKRLFEVIGKKGYRHYVGHYNSSKYREQVKKNSHGKFKPNGRIWCLIKKNTRIKLGDSWYIVDRVAEDYLRDPNLYNTPILNLV